MNNGARGTDVSELGTCVEDRIWESYRKESSKETARAGRIVAENNLRRTGIVNAEGRGGNSSQKRARWERSWRS
jgi:hypothetical protein